jgi:outer membrane protein assembly factor BamB
MRRRLLTVVFAASCVAAVLAAGTGPGVQGSTGDANWFTDGGDPQRQSWQTHEATLSTANVKDLTLLWTYQTDNQPRSMHALFPPLIAGRVDTASGQKQIAVVAGVSDNLYAIDVRDGSLIWRKHFEGGPGTSGTVFCPGGQTANAVIGPGATPGAYIVYALSWDGRLHQLDLATARDVEPPSPFTPPNAKPYALNLSHGVVYTATGQGCGGSNAFYGYDLATRKVGSFAPGSGGLWGRTGPSVGRDGTIYEGSGDGQYDPAHGLYGLSVLAVKQNPDTKALELKDWFTPPSQEFMFRRDMDLNVTSPVFEFQGREYLVESSKACRVWLLDTSALGGADHRTALYTSSPLCNENFNHAAEGVWGAISSYVDRAGARWVLVPFYGPKHTDFHFPTEYGDVVHGAVAAFRVERKAGQAVLTPAWVSRDMNHAEPPVIANGVVFAFGSGEVVTQVAPQQLGNIPTEQRIANSTHATIYALDARTGKELWSSGERITSWNHFGGLSIANGRVYISTFDGKVFCFGLS